MTDNSVDIAILMGSDSDLPIVEAIFPILDEFEINYTKNVLSAHRTPHEVMDLIKKSEQNGCKVDFTEEELVFSAIHHDLGKVGDLEHDYYIPQDNEWRRKNMGEIFKHNEKCEYMSVTDRAFYLLQAYDIPINKKEFIGIRLTDGMYEEANKSYLVAYKSEFQLRSTIQYILHQADMMASQIENRLTKASIEKDETEVQERIQSIKNVVGSPDNVTEEKPKITNDLFEELFGEKR